MPDLDLTGRQLGRYRIASLLGAGGMGSVYRAVDTSLDRQVALKVLPPELTNDASRLARFIQEAKTASALNHPHVVAVYEVGHDTVEGETVHFMAMELVDGQTLREQSHGRPMDLRPALKAVSQAAEALAAAHAAGIIHRDLKPENVMVTASGYAKVLDFGLAKLRLSEDASEDGATAVKRTDPGTVMGTVGYMSPEQAQGRTVDPRSDVFSLGCVLYEIVTGQRAFRGDSNVQTLHKIIESDPEPLVTYLPDAPLELQRIISKALAKDPDDRYQSVKDLAVDLRRLLRDMDSNPSGIVTVSSGAHAAVLPRRRAPMWLAAAAITVAIVATTAATVFWMRSRTATTTTPTTPAPRPSIEITRLTSLGKVISATISPDAKLVAYVVSDQGMQGLYVRQIATGNDLQLVPMSSVAYWSHTFTPDGNSIVYGVKSGKDPTGAFYEIPVLGGRPKFLVSGMDSPPSYSPDGKRMTWVVADKPDPRQSALVVSNSDGSGVRVVATRKDPVVFAPLFYTGPSWSPDGTIIAAPEVDLKNAAGRIVGVDPESGHETEISTGWSSLGQVAWLPDGSGLVAVGTRRAGMVIANSQLWTVPRSGGDPTPLTADLFTYRTVTLSADGKTLVSVISDVTSAVYRLRLGGGDEPVRLTRGMVDGYYGFTLMPDGRLAYLTQNGDRNAISVMNPEGTQVSSLVESDLDLKFPVVSADGRALVYLARTPRGMELRALDLEERSRERVLASGVDDKSIDITPDGRTIIYGSGGDLARISSDGGEPIPYRLGIDPRLPAVSPDGKRLAFYHVTEGGFHVSIIPIEGGAITWSHPVEPPPSSRASLEWTPDGRALLIGAVAGDRANVYRLSMDGTLEKLTRFDDQNVGDFTLLPDGSTLYVSRQNNVRDAVMIRGFR